jgi:hypothetical protein
MDLKSLSVVESEEILSHVHSRLGLDVRRDIPHLQTPPGGPRGGLGEVHGLTVEGRFVSKDEVNRLANKSFF